MMRRDRLEELTPSLSSLGYQVLLDLIATARGRLRIVELAPAGRPPASQRSELKLALELLALLIAKVSNDAVSIRFLLFCLVGPERRRRASGAARCRADRHAAVHGGADLRDHRRDDLEFHLEQYGHLRRPAPAGLAYVTGLLRFMVICGIGAVSNVGVASLIYAHDNVWWIAGLGGAVMGAVWNYAVSSVFVWRPR